MEEETMTSKMNTPDEINALDATLATLEDATEEAIPDTGPYTPEEDMNQLAAKVTEVLHNYPIYSLAELGRMRMQLQRDLADISADLSTRKAELELERANIYDRGYVFAEASATGKSSVTSLKLAGEAAVRAWQEADSWEQSNECIQKLTLIERQLRIEVQFLDTVIQGVLGSGNMRFV